MPYCANLLLGATDSKKPDKQRVEKIIRVSYLAAFFYLLKLLEALSSF